MAVVSKLLYIVIRESCLDLDSNVCYNTVSLAGFSTLARAEEEKWKYEQQCKDKNLPDNFFKFTVLPLYYYPNE